MQSTQSELATESQSHRGTRRSRFGGRREAACVEPCSARKREQSGNDRCSRFHAESGSSNGLLRRPSRRIQSAPYAALQKPEFLCDSVTLWLENLRALGVEAT